MKIGILSDTHGNLPATLGAVEAFRAAGVSAIFHCGDIGAFEVLEKLSVLRVPVHAVLGNVDAYADAWRFAPDRQGINLHGTFGDIALAGYRIALLHGDDARRFDQAVASRDFDFVFSGHSHEFHDYAVGETRCINPGTAGRGTPCTCAVLDPGSGTLQKVRI
ncbi:metallophosphoesterase [Pontiella sp.]|uniref:metallophosphoesterase family protein n=1 Tax=Pontiella sp. TaxID=2837462 RepID=UPI00356AA7A3